MSKEATHREFYDAFHAWFMSSGCDFWSECDAPESLATIAAEISDAFAVQKTQDAINTPELRSFIDGVAREAIHQRARWGDAHDRSKSAENWYWLIGYLSGKALRSHIEGDRDKALHHTISSAAALMQWHAAILADGRGNGIGNDRDLDPETL